MHLSELNRFSFTEQKGNRLIFKGVKGSLFFKPDHEPRVTVLLSRTQLLEIGESYQTRKQYNPGRGMYYVEFSLPYGTDVHLNSNNVTVKNDRVIRPPTIHAMEWYLFCNGCGYESHLYISEEDMKFDPTYQPKYCPACASSDLEKNVVLGAEEEHFPITRLTPKPIQF
jgi:hypothetical protein